MKIVIDTNVLMSALYSKRGASHKLLKWLIKMYSQNIKVNVVSVTLILEYEDVLTREKNLKMFSSLNKDDIIKFVDSICMLSYHQEINFLWRPYLKDVKDDMVLEVAFNSGSKYIITHNIKDFKGIDKFNIKAITPKEFLKIVGELK
jgi:putative PIN family toxin of toxin-antitoxin system